MYMYMSVNNGIIQHGVVIILSEQTTTVEPLLWTPLGQVLVT